MGSDADGGYVVSPEISDRIIKEVQRKNPLRQIARIQKVGSGTYELLQEVGRVMCGWVAEAR